MTSRNLARRLERLEADILPGEEEVMILRIQGVTGLEACEPHRLEGPHTAATAEEEVAVKTHRQRLARAGK
ncbi:MAG: hypothetical protein ABSH50_33400 [Bryobacteraceae bacterium]|jgi:hypothetical protein